MYKFANKVVEECAKKWFCRQQQLGEPSGVSTHKLKQANSKHKTVYEKVLLHI